LPITAPSLPSTAFVWDIASIGKAKPKLNRIAPVTPRPDQQPNIQLAPRTLVLLLGVGVAAGLVCASLINLLWVHQGLPDHHVMGALAQAARPQGLKLFVTLALPAAVVGPSLALVALILLIPIERRAQAQNAIRSALRYDAVSYLMLPVMVLLPVLWRELGNGFLATGIIFLGALSFKAAIIVRLLWKAHLRPLSGDEQAISARAQAAVFIAAWLVLGLAAAWTNQAVSTTREEAGWLLEAEAMRRGPGFAESRQAQFQATRGFYWNGGSEAAFPQISKDAVFALMIAPLLTAGGRLGVLIAFAGLMALMASQLLAWLAEAKVAREPAAGATALILFSAPMWVAGQQVLPDVPAMLLFVLGLRLLTRLERGPWAAGLGLVAVAGLLGWIKLRMAALAGGLLACGMVDLFWRRWAWRGALLSCLGLGGLTITAIWLLPQAWWPKAMVFSWGDILAGIQDAPSLWRAASHALAGVLLDQNYGILIAAPIFILALAGIPACLVSRRRAALLALVPAFLYVAAVCFLRWHLWYGGLAGPGRLLVVVLPALALPLALALAGLSKPWWRLWALVPLVLGMAYTWLISLVPAWRYSLPTGVNPLAAALEDALGLFLNQLLPSLLTPSIVLTPWLAGTLALLLLLAIPIWRHTRREDQGPATGLGRVETLALALICGALVLGGLAWGSLARITSAQAEGMRAPKVKLWSSGHGPGAVRGQSLADGGSLSCRLYFDGGETKVRLTGTPKAEGRVTLSLDGRVFEQPWPLERDYALVELGPVKQGVHKISVGWSSCIETRCVLLLDKVEVAQVSSQASGLISPPQSSP
jgi:hypothetical protein